MPRNWKLIVKVVFAFIGLIAGISACAVFVKKYHNYNAAVWAAISAVYALLFIHTVFSVRRDPQRTIDPARFLLYMFVAGVGMFAGLTAIIVYLVLGATHKEGVDGQGRYVVVVWGFMTFKWSLFLFLVARSYHKMYIMDLNGESDMIVNG